MDAKSQLKVISAGFTIIRVDDQPSIRIKYKDKDNKDWKTYQSFPNKHQRDKAFAELLLLTHIIQD